MMQGMHWSGKICQQTVSSVSSVNIGDLMLVSCVAWLEKDVTNKPPITSRKMLSPCIRVSLSAARHAPPDTTGISAEVRLCWWAAVTVILNDFDMFSTQEPFLRFGPDTTCGTIWYSLVLSVEPPFSKQQRCQQCIASNAKSHRKMSEQSFQSKHLQVENSSLV